MAIECGDRRLTYRDLHEQVNTVGTALRSQLGVRPEERIVLLMLDGPEMIAAFFGAIKIGAVPVPLNTRWTAAEYEYAIRDSSARVVILSNALAGEASKAIAACQSVRHVVVVGDEIDENGRSASKRSSPPGPRNWRPRRPAATRPHSGCIRPAPPAARRAASTCSTTWACARTPTPAACSASTKATGASAWPSCSSRTGWETAWTSRSRLAPPASSGPGPSRRPWSTTSSNAAGRRCSSRCRRITR